MFVYQPKSRRLLARGGSGTIAEGVGGGAGLVATGRGAGLRAHAEEDGLDDGTVQSLSALWRRELTSSVHRIINTRRANLSDGKG